MKSNPQIQGTRKLFGAFFHIGEAAVLEKQRPHFQDFFAGSDLFLDRLALRREGLARANQQVPRAESLDLGGSGWAALLSVAGSTLFEVVGLRPRALPP